MRKKHDEAVHFSGHLRMLMCYSCPLLWTLAHARLLCVVHFSGHLCVLVLVMPIYLMASQCRCRELSVADIYRITYGYQLYQFGIISTLLICFIGRNSSIMEFYNQE